jgi:Methyltransferase FkbM domain
MPIVKLPLFLVPFNCNTLIRIGRENDGGYLLNSEDLHITNLLLSFGINDDWSFEEQFLKRKDVPLKAYDASISLRKFAKNFKRSIPFALKSTARYWQVVRSYKAFFRGSRVHIKKFVGMDFEPMHISLKSIFAEQDQNSDGKVFLKIDIEGSEYRLLNDLLLHSDRIAGAVIEFHDVDLHLHRIEDFIKRAPLKLVNTHCNNFVPVTEAGLPLVIECCFSSSIVGSKLQRVLHLPHKLDQPNNKTQADYRVDVIG